MLSQQQQHDGTRGGAHSDFQRRAPSCVQWNCRGLYANYEGLKLLLKQHQPACVCLQEVTLGSRPPPSLTGYEIYLSSPHTTIRGGAAIMVRNTVPHHFVPIRSDLQVVAIRVYLQRQYTVCSIYISPQSNIFKQDLEDLIRQLPEPFLLLGDLNSRSPVWGDVKTTFKAPEILSVIEENDLVCLNEGQPTYCHPATQTLTCIDLSICSSEVALDFDWMVEEDDRGSDHFPIVLKSTQAHTEEVRYPRWISKRANWPAFRDATEIITTVADIESAEVGLNHLKEVVMNAAQRYIPKSSAIGRIDSVPWWNEKCQVAWLKKKHAQKRYLQSKTVRNKVLLNMTRARLRRSMKLSRRESWRDYVSSITSDTPVSSVWQKIRKIERRGTQRAPPVLKINGNLVADSSEVARELANTFAAVSRTTNPAGNASRDDARPVNFLRNDDEEDYNLPFTVEEYSSALSSRESTAPGWDDITYDMLKHLHPSATAFLLALYNKIWLERSFPADWREIVIVPIHKAGKDSSNPRNYRPIALLSCLYKLLEKMVANRLSYELEKNEAFSSTQSAFRRFRSTEEPLLLLSREIQMAFTRGQVLLAVFFDIEKAYDTTNRKLILRCLEDLGFKGNLPIFIQNFIQQPSIRVRVAAKHSDPVNLDNGVVQGSVLSVLCFSLVMNTVISYLPRTVQCSLYADDLCIYYKGSSLALVERQMQLAVNSVNKWSADTGFTISKQKSAQLLFKKRNPEEIMPALILGGEIIPRVTEHRFLGLIFDQHFNWLPHIHDLKARCRKALNIFNVLSHTQWGADRATLMHLFTALIQSKLDYGSVIYGAATESRLKLLDPIHNAGLRYASGAFKSSPVVSLQAECDTLSLSDRRDEQRLRSLARISRVPDSNLRTTITEDINQQNPWDFNIRICMMLHEFQIEAPNVIIQEVPEVPPWTLTAVKCCRGIRENKDVNKIPAFLKATFLEHLSQHTDSVHIYTDGSKTTQGTAAAAIFNHGDLRKYQVRIASAASNFTAELYGFLEALKAIDVSAADKYTIFSDSLSAIESLKQFAPRNPLVLEIRQKIHRLSNFDIDLQFCWVPAHVGIPGNEMADAAAKEAQSLRQIDCPLPFSDFYPKYKTHIRNRWQTKWTNAPQPIKLRKVKPQLRRWSSSYNKTRYKEVLLARLRIGHTRLTHEYLMNKEQQPICGECNSPLTVEHLMVHCPKYRAQRGECFPNLYKYPINQRIVNILAEDKEFSSEQVFKFVKMTNLWQNL